MKSDAFDEILQIELCKQNIKEFAPLYEKYYLQIFRFIYKRMENRDDCEDLTSMVFMKAMSKIKVFEIRENQFSSWLYRIAFNEVNLFYRSKKVQEKYFIEIESIRETMDDIYEEDVKETILIETLENLSEDDYNLLQLKYFDGLSFKEISQIYQKSEDSLKVKMHRLRTQIKNGMIHLSHSKGIEIAMFLGILFLML